MKTRAWMLVVVLASPVLAPAQEQPARNTQRAADTPAHAPRKTSFATTSPEVRQILRDTAAAAENGLRIDTVPSEDSRAHDPGLSVRFRAPRRVDHMKCKGDDCIAYNADGTELYTVSPDGRFQNNSWSTGDYYDAWLSCQSSNNLLTTFERFDRCRGINIGVPSLNNVLTIALPRIDTK